jgi:YegS/Rv2252/BmrU family lipid kinase
MDGSISSNGAKSRGRALFLGNLGARQVAERLDHAFALLRDSGVELLPKRIRKPRDIGTIIRDYHKSVDFVVIGGGDGTLNAAADALVETGLPLGVLPLGTANDLAHTLGVPADLEQACGVIQDGYTRQIDVGCVNGKHYFNVAGMGMSVEITKRLTHEVKKRWGVMAYLLTASSVLRNLRPFSAEIRCGDEVHRVKTVQITIGNGRYYGGALAVAEDAAIDDQRLDLYSLEVDHWWQMIPLMLALRSGKLKGRPLVRTLHGQEFHIATRRRRAVNADGEIIAYTPASFRVVPKAVRVFTPRGPNPTAGLSENMSETRVPLATS